LQIHERELIADLPLFIAAGIAAGAGAGVVFRSAVAVAASLALPPSRGEVLAALFLVAYAGLAIPALLVGVALTFLPSTGVFVGFAAAVLVLAVGSSLGWPPESLGIYPRHLSPVRASRRKASLS
jgi:hypothetical protein